MSEITLTRDPAHVRHGSSIGQPLTRRDGVLKVTGAARYAADNHPPGMLHAVMAVSSIARGRVTSLDVAAAKTHPGVVEVMTPQNRPPLADDPDAKTNPFMFRMELLQNDRVRYANQPIAVVIAETLEAATEGAALLAPRYEAEPARAGLDDDDSFVPPAVGVGHPAVVAHGDVEGALAGAAHTIDATYETPAQYHNPMEPHAIVASWDGDTLSIDMPSQGMAMAQGAHRRPVRHLAGQDPHPQPVPRRRLRLQGAGQGSAGPRHPGRQAGRPARQARAAPRADVRPRRPSLAEPAAAAHRHRARTGKLDRDRPSRQNRDLAASTTSSSRRPTPRTRSMRARRSRPRTRRCGSTPARRCSCARRERRRDRWRSKARSTRWRRPAAWIRSPSVSRTMPRSSRSPASRSPRRRCANATPGPRNNSAGRSGRCKPRQMRDDDGFLVGWGMGTATFPALMFAGRGARGDPRRRHRA